MGTWPRLRVLRAGISAQVGSPGVLLPCGSVMQTETLWGREGGNEI